MTRCSCGLIRIGGDAGGHELGEVAELITDGLRRHERLAGRGHPGSDPANPPT